MVLNAIGMSFDASFRDQAMQYYGFTSRAESNSSAAILGAWRSFLFVGGAAALAWTYLNNRLSLKVAGMVLVGWLIADLWSIERSYWQFMPPASQTFASDPAIDSIKADIAPRRTGTRALPRFSRQHRAEPTGPDRCGRQHGLCRRDRRQQAHLRRCPFRQPGLLLGSERRRAAGRWRHAEPLSALPRGPSELICQRDSWTRPPSVQELSSAAIRYTRVSPPHSKKDSIVRERAARSGLLGGCPYQFLNAVYPMRYLLQWVKLGGKAEAAIRRRSPEVSTSGGQR